MSNQLIGVLVSDIVPIFFFLYLTLKAFEVIKTEDERKREKMTSKNMKIISVGGLSCFVILLVLDIARLYF